MLPTSLPMFYSSSVEMPRTSGLMPAMTLCHPNNENPAKACFRAVWTAFIINYGESDKTTKGLQDFLQKAKKPANMKLYNFKT
jgi:hypothetical protein